MIWKIIGLLFLLTGQIIYAQHGDSLIFDDSTAYVEMTTQDLEEAPALNRYKIIIWSIILGSLFITWGLLIWYISKNIERIRTLSSYIIAFLHAVAWSWLLIEMLILETTWVAEYLGISEDPTYLAEMATHSHNLRIAYLPLLAAAMCLMNYVFIFFMYRFFKYGKGELVNPSDNRP
ncbi:MAG: hypothetical protein MK212_00185 [Saprospiraceae bacterium]|nr:hypothetical protein [Saprospiraceae bacterium]